MRLTLVSSKMKWILVLALQILEVDIEALTGFSHIYYAGVFNNVSPSQGCFLGADSGNWKGQQNPCFKDRGGGEEPLIARVQLPGQSVVTSF